MRLVLKDEKYAFTVTKAAEPRTEYGSGQQKMNRATKLPEWTVEVLALDSERGEVIRVTVTGDQPKCPVPEMLRHLPPRLRHSAGRCHWVEALCSPARVIIPAPGVLPES